MFERSITDADDILVLDLPDKPIAHEISQDWNTHISCAEDSTMVEIVMIDAAATGTFPLKVLRGKARLRDYPSSHGETAVSDHEEALPQMAWRKGQGNNWNSK